MEQIISVGKAVASRLIGFIIFLILLLIANLIIPYVGTNLYNSIVYFLNDNINAMFIFMTLLIIGEVFGALTFPLNLPAPLFTAVGSVFLVKFMFGLIEFLNSLIKMPVNLPYDAFRNLAYVLAFVLVIIIGYIRILIEAGKSHMTVKAEKRNEKKQKMAKKKK